MLTAKNNALSEKFGQFKKEVKSRTGQSVLTAKNELELPSLECLQKSTFALTQLLIEQPSITPHDAGCLTIIEERLRKIGMTNERMDFSPVSNLYASLNNKRPIFAFIGHTDVVPPGDLNNWFTDPFKAIQKDGFLHGRGSVDMKSSVAAMVVAFEAFSQLNVKPRLDFAIALTSDEEGDAVDGMQYLVNKLQARGQQVKWALVGEPSSENTIGDCIKIGRRGSLTAHITLKGRQGHVGYPQQIINPVKAMSKFLNKLQNKQWDLPSRFFPATSLQVVKLDCDSGAENISPAAISATFNMRFSPKQTVTKLQKYIEKKLQKTELEYCIDWKVDAEPFITRRSKIRQIASKVVYDVCHIKPKLSTAGGTSDGRFLAKAGAQVIELGLCNKGIHQANEKVPIKDLGVLSLIYLKMMLKMNDAAD